MSDRNNLVSSNNLCVSTLIAVLLVALAPAAGLAQSVIPVALDFSADGELLFVANRDGASVSVLCRKTREPVREFEVRGQPIDLLVSGEQVLVLDRQHSKLRVYDGTGKQQAEHELLAPPARMTSNADGDQVFVASTFGRVLLSFMRVGDEWARCSSCKLPFPPLEMKCVDDRLLVAGAFEAELALLDCSQIQRRIDILQLAQLRGHNIRGIELIDEEIYLTLQELNPLAHSSRDDVHWGNLLANKLVHFPTEALLERTKGGEAIPLSSDESPRDLNLSRTDFELGEPGNGSGDPGRLLYDASEQRLFILLTGSSQLLEFDLAQQEILRRIDTGTAPRAIASKNGRLAIANQFSDSLSWITFREDEPGIRKTHVTPLADSKPTAVQRGEQLFFDSRLSHDGWMSCHSCHSNGHSSGQLNDNQSDGGFGAAKRIPSLLGVAHTAPWGWTGQFASLEQQVKNSIELTMHGDGLNSDQVDDLVAYMNSLQVPDWADGHSAVGGDAKLVQGKELFRNLGCSACHQSDRNFTSSKTYDVGWEDRQGNKRFNPPSLLGLRVRPRLFHDARSNLETMLELGEHKLQRELSESEQQQLLRYLKSL